MKKTNVILILSLINLIIPKLLAQKESDTIFLLREKGHTIYLEPNKNSFNYVSLSNFSHMELKNETFQILGLQSKWIPLYSYKSKYYLYLPCDLGTGSRISFSNNRISFEEFEIYSFAIDSKIKKIDDTYYRFTYKDFEKKSVCLEIHIIDSKKGIALFKFISENRKISYRLMVSSENLKEFPLIVNNCISNRTKEVRFDEINFEKMLK
jgi:hypothetical protein